MNQKNVKGCILFILLLLTIGSLLLVNAEVEKNPKDIDILETIQLTKNKILISDEISNEIRTRYWIHSVENVEVKNDFIRLKQHVKTNEIIEFEKEWTLEEKMTLSTTDYFSISTEEDFLWKKPIVFPEQNDLTYFYTITQPSTFPLYCLEVRCINGETFLYNSTGQIIGHGIPAPSGRKGFSLSGYCQDSSPDCWIQWRQNADVWYKKWADETTSISLPTPTTISSYISNSDYYLFYELAHGASTYFQADSPGVYYYASDAEEALRQREKMTFSFIGSCEGMTETGDGTFSHEFRKGSTEDTVTIGYSGMGSCPGWSVSLQWQDYMFYIMDAGYTIKDAFTMACDEYPSIADCVVFVGDTDLTIFDEDEEDDDEIGIPPNLLVTYPGYGQAVSGLVNISGKTDDLDGYVDHVYLQIDNLEWVEIEETDIWQYSWDTTLVEDGEHLITAVAIDNSGLSSGCYYIRVNVSNTPLNVTFNCPSEIIVGEQTHFESVVTGGMPPYTYEWNFGEGTSKNPSPIHIFNQEGIYEVSLTVYDQLNRSETISKKLSIILKDKLPPTISIVKPENALYINDNKLFYCPKPVIIGPINLLIQATDKESEIQNVTVTINGRHCFFFSEEPYTGKWDNFSFGSYKMTIAAYDQANNQAYKELVLWKFF